jgi:hypothetical protein
VEFAMLYGEEGQLKTHVFSADEIQALVEESGVLEAEAAKTHL